MLSKRGLGMLAATTLAAVLAPAAGVAAPGEAARPRVVVVNAVDLPDSLADIRAQLRTTLNDAVTKHGYDLAPQAGSCADRECLHVAAVNAGASDVLVATGADPLLDRVPTLHANLSATAMPPAAPAAAAPAVPLVTTPAPSPEVKRQHRWLGWTLIGAGVAAGAASGLLFAINGDTTDPANQPASGYPIDARQRTTLAPAIVTAGISAAAIAGGILYLLHGSEDHPGVALGIQPFGLTLGGRL